jgi:hypothetical protein
MIKWMVITILVSGAVTTASPAGRGAHTHQVRRLRAEAASSSEQLSSDAVDGGDRVDEQSELQTPSGHENDAPQVSAAAAAPPGAGLSGAAQSRGEAAASIQAGNEAAAEVHLIGLRHKQHHRHDLHLHLPKQPVERTGECWPGDESQDFNYSPQCTTIQARKGRPARKPADLITSGFWLACTALLSQATTTSPAPPGVKSAATATSRRGAASAHLAGQARPASSRCSRPAASPTAATRWAARPQAALLVRLAADAADPRS